MSQMWLLAGGSLGLRCPSIVMQAENTNAEIARLLRQQNDEMQTRLNGLVVSTGAPSQFAAAPLSGGLVTNRARLTLPLAVGGAAVADRAIGVGVLLRHESGVGGVHPPPRAKVPD